MPISLYQATVPTFIQITSAVRALLDRAESHCNDNNLPPSALVDSRLIDDMWPLAHQIRAVANHSYGAVTGLRAGVFGPYYDDIPSDFAGLRRELDDATAGLNAIEEAEMETFIGKPMRFAAGSITFDFSGEDFLLSFAQPNFFFHATTSYDILRARGLDVGKRDFLAGIRVKRS